RQIKDSLETTLESLDGFPNADTVFPAAAEVIDRGRLRVDREKLAGTGNVVGMQLIADLFALIAVDRVGPPLPYAAGKVGKEAVLHRASVICACNATTAKANRIHAEGATVLLHVEVGRKLRGAEQRVARLIDRKPLVETGKLLVGELVSCF